jgi:hypothetical protein
MVVPGCHIDEERVEVLSELTLGGEYIMEGKGARRFHSRATEQHTLIFKLLTSNLLFQFYDVKNEDKGGTFSALMILAFQQHANLLPKCH